MPIAAALAAVIAVGSAGDTRAQDRQKEQRGFVRKGPVKGPAVAPRRNFANPAGPNRFTATPPQGRVPGPGGPRRDGTVRGPLNAKGPDTKGHEARRLDPKDFRTRSALPRSFDPRTRSGDPRFTRNNPRFEGNRLGNPRVFNRDPRFRAVNAATPRERFFQRNSHRAEIFAFRARLPVRPLPFERDFTGVPPPTERRYVTTELVFQAGPNVTPQQVDEMARRHNCVPVGTQTSSLTGGTLIRFRIAGTQSAADMVRAMEADRLGVAQPNYVYETLQAPAAAAPSEQYVADKLKLAEVHKLATGKGVLVAVIDSKIDSAHPELGSAVAESFDAAGITEKPHAHGTGMLGAIVSQDRLTGIAPIAKALAVQAFAMGTRQSPQATTQAIVAGLEWAIQKGARVVNMSFAGPQDPMLALAMKKAHEKGVILIAAAGNAGAKSPPLYPAADPSVIAVSATDQNDAPYENGNRGAHVAVAAPGVNVLAAAPEAAYQITTGTSVAAAHVSGVAALLLERHPDADPATILEVLTATATRLSGDKRDDRVGWGLIDPAAAIAELDARQADAKVAPPAQPAPATPLARPAAAPTTPVARAPAMPPSPATTRSALPRPGIYAPKQLPRQ